MDAIIALVGYIGEFFDWVVSFFTVTLVELLKDAIAWFMVKATISFIDFKIYSIQFAWDIASSVLDSFNVGSVISSYASSLDSSISYVASMIGLFDAFNMVIQATLSSFVLKIMRL